MTEKFVFVILFMSVFVISTWYFLLYVENWNVNQECKWCFPIERSLSLLVISCPCALGLAIPIVIIVTLNLAIKKGILIKDVETIKEINSITTVVFDKTGTLFNSFNKVKET